MKNSSFEHSIDGSFSNGDFIDNYESESSKIQPRIILKENFDHNKGEKSDEDSNSDELEELNRSRHELNIINTTAIMVEPVKNAEKEKQRQKLIEKENLFEEDKTRSKSNERSTASERKNFEFNSDTNSDPRKIPYTSNFISLLEFNKDNITLNLCEKINCFIKRKFKVNKKNFSVISKKKIIQVASISSLTLEKLLKAFEDCEEIQKLEKNIEWYENQEYSLLSVYQFYFLITNFRGLFLRVFTQSVLERVLESTKKSFELVFTQKNLLSIEDILSISFQMFVVTFFNMSYDRTLLLTVEKVEEAFVEILFEERFR